MSNAKTLILLDGMALAYRGHFALIRTPRMTAGGINTSSVFVFTNTIEELLRHHNPSHIAVAFDTPEPTPRHTLYPDYKAQREAMPEDLQLAIPMILRLCEAYRIPILRIPGLEADDIIGTLAHNAEPAGYETLMVTPDKDYGQLVTDRTRILLPAKGGAAAEILGPAEVCTRWQIKRIDQLLDLMALMGDASDNIPGVQGVGEKTAARLIAEFDSLDGVYRNVDTIPGKLGEKLRAGRDMAYLSRKLVTIITDASLPLSLDALQRQTRNDDQLAALFREWEFDALARRILGSSPAQSQRLELSFSEPTQAEKPVPKVPAPGEAPTALPLEPAGNFQTLATTPHDYHVASTATERRSLAAELRKHKSFCFDTETTGLDPRSSRLVGLSFSTAAHAGCYVPMPEDEADCRAALADLAPALQDGTIEKSGHNLKFDLAMLHYHGVDVAPPFFDTMLVSQILQPDGRHSMDALSRSLLNYDPVPITALIGEDGPGQRSMADVPLAQIADYAAEDADVTFQLAVALRPRIAETGQDRILRDIELPLLPVLTRMECEGIRIDTEALAQISVEFGRQIETIKAHIFELAGTDFLLSSPKELGRILFDKLQLAPDAKRTGKTGQYQTNEKVLQALAPRHEIVREVLRFREYAKLKSTYVDALPQEISPRSGRVHTHYEQAFTATGRLQSHSPNLQNIPIRSDLGREIRKAFVPRDADHILLSADYSQIELRVMAELSGDAGMMAAFQRNEDIHAATAASIHGVGLETVTPEMRRIAKMVNFGIIYGISAFGLAERLGIGRTAAGGIIDAYFKKYPGVKTYMDDTIARCREQGYVETLLGRRRYIRDIDSRNGTLRQAAERTAINSRIQGTAADLIKLAMVTIDQELLQGGFRSKLLLQVHDELVFDLHRSEEKTLPALVDRCMTSAIPLRVPVVVEIGTGTDWLAAH